MRNLKRAIWTSSYDRGLEHLLDIWPEVKKEVPEAELQITYGWELFLAAHTKLAYNPERIEWKNSMDKKMKQPGITHLGRVGQQEMVKLLSEAGVWAYPTDFDEISCISAMKAQCYGAIPVTMAKAALKETVKFGVLVEGDIYDPEVKKKYSQELIEALNGKWDKTREPMMAECRQLFGWKSVAEKWIEEFKQPKVGTEEWAKEFVNALPAPGVTP